MATDTSPTVHFNDVESFENQALSSGTVAAVDFWAEWCAPCKALGPIVDQVASEYQGKALVGKVDVDNLKDLAVRYGISSIPTIIFFKDGEVADKVVGVASKDDLTARIDKLLG